MKQLVFLLALCIVTVLATHENPLERLHMYNAYEAYDLDVQVKATPDHLPETFGWVTVKWTGVATPTKEDFIGVYPQSPFHVTQTPAKYKFCFHSATHMKDGSGSLEFRLVNMRAPYTFVLFRGGEKNPVAVASSNEVHFANYNEPLQVHLALTHDVTQMQVSWTTLNSSAPQVRWGNSSGHYPWTASATSATYTASQMCGAPATTHGFIDPGMQHNAVMTDLLAGHRYYYIVGDATHGWTKEFTFEATFLVEPATPFKFVAFGDMGKAEVDHSVEHWEEYSSLETTSYVQKEVLQNNHSLVLHIGDIAYAVGFAAQWDDFMAQVQPIAAHVPYMTCIGNHERDFPDSGSFYNGKDSGGECGVPYEHRFRMPRPSQDQPWYSFNYGSVHFVLMSTEHNFEQGSVQYKFLQEDLSKVNRARTPWVIFSGHRPMYSANPAAASLREHIEPLLFNNKVNLALWGHDHNYQRTCPLHQEKCVPKKPDGGNNAPVHLVIGMAGASFSETPKHKPDWVEMYDNTEHGYSRISVTEHELVVDFINDKGVQRDTVTIKK